jgi:hypothetical protein
MTRRNLALLPMSRASPGITPAPDNLGGLLRAKRRAIDLFRDIQKGRIILWENMREKEGGPADT